MGTTSEKLTYLNETKQELKQAINNLGGSITDETTFRQYVDQLGGVYDVLPKTEFQEGTEVTIENGLKGKLDYEDDKVGYGDTEQESYEGYNLIDITSGTIVSSIVGITTSISGDILTINGSRNDGSTTNAKAIINDILKFGTLTSGETYKIFLNIISGSYTGSIAIAFANSNNSQIEYIQTTNGNYYANRTLTFNENVAKLRIAFNGNFTANNLKVQIMLQKGTTEQVYEPYVGNSPSPNPSYPQDIEVVRGKNRLDDSSLVLFNSNKYISTSNFSTEGKIEIKPSSTYSLVYKKSTINDFNMWEFDSSNNKTAISSTGSDNGNYRVRLFTTLSTTKTMSFYAGSNDTYTSIEEFLQAKELMLLEGDYSSQAIPSYLPYNTIGVKARGKNLADNSKLVNGYMTAEGIWHYGSGNEYRSTDLIEVKEGKTYTSSLYNKNKERIAYLVWTTYDINKNFIAQYTTTNLVISSGVKYIRARNYQIQTSYIINDDYLYQVEENNTPTNYEPYYTPQIKQLSLGDIELCKIGNYQDYLYKSGDKWYKHEEVGKIILDGSTDEHWFIEAHPAPTEISNRFICDNLPSLDVTTQKDFNYGFCNLGHISSNAQYATDLNAIRLRYINGQNRLDCMFDIESVAILKPLLQNTPMKVYYQKLGGTTDIELPDTTLIEQLENWYNSKSFFGTTIIESNGDLPMIIKVRALKGE